ARLWDAATGAPVNETLRFGEDIHGVAFGAEKGMIAVKTKDRIRVWDVDAHYEIASINTSLGSWGTDFAFRPDGQQIITMDEISAVKFWNTRSGQKEGPALPRHSSYAVQFSPDGGLLVLAGK